MTVVGLTFAFKLKQSQLSVIAANSQMYIGTERTNAQIIWVKWVNYTVYIV